jgi:preprotein translocase subunit SecA
MKLGLTEGESIAHPWLNNAIEKAQRKVEGHHFDIRKQLLEYDDVANQQRKVIYTQRKNILEAKDIKEAIYNMIEEVIPKFVDEYIPKEALHDEWNIEGLQKSLKADFNLDIDVNSLVDKNLTSDEINAEILNEFLKFYADKEQSIGESTIRNLEKVILLNVLDNLWKEHLATLDYLRQSIHLRGYAQKDPKQEYKQEAFILFSNMLDLINKETISTLAVMQVRDKKEVEDLEIEQQKSQDDLKLTYKHEDIHESLSQEEQEALKNQNATYVRDGQKIGRNDPCECGSGKKYKHCHGKI